MIRIGIRTLRSTLTECVRQAATGTESYEIACHGKVLARLVGAESDVELEKRIYALDGKAQSAQCESGDAQDPMLLIAEVRSPELRQISKQKMIELEKLEWDELVEEFISITSVSPDASLTDRDIRIAIARIQQVRLWVEQTGFVPGDIAMRDLQFWFRLLATLSVKDAVPETVN